MPVNGKGLSFDLYTLRPPGWRWTTGPIFQRTIFGMHLGLALGEGMPRSSVVQAMVVMAVVMTLALGAPCMGMHCGERTLGLVVLDLGAIVGGLFSWSCWGIWWSIQEGASVQMVVLQHPNAAEDQEHRFW